MAFFRVTQKDLDELRSIIATQFPPHEREEVYALVEPFTEDGIRVPTCILYLAAGDKRRVEHYAHCARMDYRDVIFWAENPRECALDAPDKIDDFQSTLEWMGETRDQELDAFRDELIAEQAEHDRQKQRPWWRFWSSR